MIDRRHFLISASGAITASTLPNAFAKSVDQKNNKELSNPKTVQQGYINKIGDSFLVRSEDGSTRLTLEDVESGRQHEGLESFRLVFTNQTKQLSENIYSVTHLASLRTQQINIVPSQSSNSHYIASFCLLS